MGSKVMGGGEQNNVEGSFKRATEKARSPAIRVLLM